MSNELIHSHSPYLLQHAQNPVNWVPWSKKALKTAEAENKLVIISIGYSACHWCHVMEHESFEDQEVAALMNQYFVCIKVDREERPDVDQVYMNAAMIINGQGGWPLNAIALPSGQPVFAGTYFPKRNWMQLLSYFADLYQKDPQKLLEQAKNVTEGLSKMDSLPKLETHVQLESSLLDISWTHWSSKIDKELGGRNGAPKFMMPNNYDYLLRYAYSSKNEEVKTFVQNTLEKIALGGINDAVSGGFSRYSTDARWHIPHFEKMLYDNAQLISIYAQAYRLYKNPLYLEVIENTFRWLQNEMKAEDGGYYAALDADSEGIEGKYYVWSWRELKLLLGEKLETFAKYYQSTFEGNWEHGLNHLHSDQTLEGFCNQNNLDLKSTKQEFDSCKEILQKNRNQRIRPGLDNKRITGWNALLISGFVNAYWANEEQKYLDTAIEIAEFFEKSLQNGKGLWHTYNNGQAYIEGYLSDYAPAIQAYIELYPATFEEKYLTQAYQWMEFVIDHFYDEKSGMFYLNSDQAEQLVSRPIEISDNVISSSNAIMARCLGKLGHYFDKAILKEMSEIMLQTVMKDMLQNGAFYAEWSILLWENIYTSYEVVFTSENQKQQLQEVWKDYLPQILPIGNQIENSTIPLTQGKESPYIYVCRNQTCQAPITHIDQMNVKL